MIEEGVCTVAVDVGNTAVKLAVLRGGVVADHAIAIDSAKWHSDAIDWVSDQLGCGRTHWRISSVHQRAAKRLTESISQLPEKRTSDVRQDADDNTVELVSYKDVPMQVMVESPKLLGIDRLLSAFAATRLTESDHAANGMVVIDAGSAITVDWIEPDGSYRGGAILPGLGLQAKALATGTDALPQIDWTKVQDPILPATNTHDAIYGGILVGAAAAIDALAKRYFADGVRIDRTNMVITGGDSTTLSRYLSHPHQCHQNLVCRGLLELHGSELFGSR